MKECIYQILGMWESERTYYLVIADEQGLQMPQREPFQIDIAFAVDEFDFFS